MGGKITQKDIENAIYLSQQYQKSIEEKSQPLFNLTAEEVEIVERNLTYFFKSDKEEVDNLLTRIKQWQDERDSK